MADVIPSYQVLIDQIGLNRYYMGTPHDDLHVEFLSYMTMGKDLQWLSATEDHTNERFRQQRIQMRISPENLVQACAANNLPFVVMHWASQRRIADINEPVLFMNVLATPLMWACRRRHVGIVRFLLDHGADPSIVCGDEKSSALHYAISGGDPDIVRLLLDDERTDPNQRNSLHCDAAMTAIAHGNLLLLWMICEDEHLEKEKALAEDRSELPRRQFHRMDIHATTTFGHTLLHYAAWRNCLSACQYLVERWNSDVDAVDKMGRTPLIWASREGNTAVVEYLVKSGADPFHPDNDGITAVQYAATRNHPETLRALNGMLKSRSSSTTPPSSLLSHGDAGAAMPNRMVSTSSRYIPCAQTRAMGTLASIRANPIFRAVFISGFALLTVMVTCSLFMPPVLSYMVGGLYVFRNYLWLYYHDLPIHQDGSQKPSAVSAVGRTLYCAFRGTWITRYRNPANLVLFLGLLYLQCLAWNRLGMPPVWEMLTFGVAGSEGVLKQEGAMGPSPLSRAAAEPPTAFFGGFLFFLFPSAARMMSVVLNALLLSILWLTFWCKFRGTRNVIPKQREEHWTRSPIWRFLRARSFDFYHPRVMAVERHFEIPVRAFHCSERDVYVERYDSYSALLDTPLSSSNKVAWVWLLTLLAVQQLLILVWGVQLMQSTMKCSWEDRQLFSGNGIQRTWSGAVTTTSAPVTSSSTSRPSGVDASDSINQLETPVISLTTVLMNIGLHALPCRQTPYLENVLKVCPYFMKRFVYWYIVPSWSSYYGVFVLHLSMVSFLWAAALALRQWKSTWYGVSTTELANPVAPREDGKLVSIFVPRNAMRENVLCHKFDVEEEQYYRIVAPDKCRSIPPKDASQCIYANTRSGLANVLLFLLGLDGKKWRNAKTISYTNTPVTSSLLSDVPLPSWDNLLLGTTSSYGETTMEDLRGTNVKANAPL